MVPAAVPVLIAYGRMPRPRLWRAVSWVGGMGLVLFSGANTVVAQLVLVGVIRTEDGYDPLAMAGHAWLWDPLFALWGGTLVLWLVVTRRPAPRTGLAPAPSW